MSETCTARAHSASVYFVPYEKWSLHSYITLLVDNYENVDKMDAHFSFYKTLSSINDNENMFQETKVLKAINSFWTSSSSHKGKKRKCLLKIVIGDQRSVKIFN
ncbi:968_t:CDS:2 [Funneliformis caledonium]|uniref:968_t:CDS:1 n=1 Tax=Funneliformis caledonium TaxID=1117310 RepID=A0A9N9DPT9_9GLOM|nr:968_t:CDS:2 [Funneliformis caledonium]